MNIQIIEAVESSIDKLVDGFIYKKWHHRVEHSLHCELFGLLKEFPILRTTISGKNFSTQLVHKEWPEPKPRPNHNRRGNFDLAILQPHDCTEDVHHFRYGKLPVAVAIEVGLNYELEHLLGDVHKLRHSDIPACYLIHFATEHGRDQEGVLHEVARLIAAESRSRIKIAYADFGVHKMRKLSESAITDITVTQ